MRELFLLLSCTQNQYHFNVKARADLLWWYTFLQECNGFSFFPSSRPSIVVTSDASGSFGYGAFSQHGWFQVQWPDTWQSISIALCRWSSLLLPGAGFGNTKVLVFVAITWQWLVCLKATHHVTTPTEHVPGVHNTTADALLVCTTVYVSSVCTST